MGVMEACLNTTEKAPDTVRKPYRRPSRAVKAQVLTHENIDGRLKPRKKFDAIARGVAQDIGGEDQLSTALTLPERSRARFSSPHFLYTVNAAMH